VSTLLLTTDTILTFHPRHCRSGSHNRYDSPCFKLYTK